MNHTVQRDAILKALRCSAGHPSADEIYAVLKRDLPQISLATVYRNLEQMVANGILKKISFKGKQTRFDIDMTLHFHVICPICGKISDIDNSEIFRISELIDEKISRLGLDGYGLDFLRYCDNCRKKIKQTTTPRENKKILSLLD